jgi:predicted phage terminase large subunit-like protein
MPVSASLIDSLAALPSEMRAALLAECSNNEIAAIEAEFAARCRADFLTFAEEAQAALGEPPASHHRLLCRELQAVADGRVNRLMVCMPPGSAKSTYASKLFPAWYLAQRPRLTVIGASHTADLAEAFSGRVMSVVREHQELLGYGLETSSVRAWRTTSASEYKSAGVGGNITGRRGNLAIIDDPVKSREHADSEAVRDKQWAWWNADLRTRLKPGAAVVLIMTRWHEDDLGGRLLQSQGDLWRVLKLPAIAGEDDPLNRAPGEYLWSDDRYGYAAELRAIRAELERNGAVRDWEALYQQNPRPGEGALFKVAMIATLDAAPAGGVIVRGWDLAATEQIGTGDPDWTVGVKLQLLPDGRFTVLDVTRLRGGPEAIEQAIVNTAAADGHGVAIGLPQDPGQAGKGQVRYLTAKLVGYRVHSSPETGDKATRAAPVASQVNVGNVSVIRGSWNRAFIEELRDFPSGRKDDQVDALSRAFAMLINPARPAHSRFVPHMTR